MMNSKNKLSAAIVLLLFANILLLSACKDKEPGETEFDLAVAESDVITIDSIVDDTTGGNSYKASFSILNNYFRTACEENSVYLDDVISVTLKSAEADFIAPAGNSFSSFKNIRAYAHDDALGTDLMASKDDLSGNPVNLTLTTTSNNLQKYFRLLYTPIDVYIGQEDLNFVSADVKFKFVFHVKGKQH